MLAKGTRNGLEINSIYTFSIFTFTFKTEEIEFKKPFICTRLLEIKKLFVFALTTIVIDHDGCDSAVIIHDDFPTKIIISIIYSRK